MVEIMDINLDKHVEGLSDINKMRLREHISKGYELAEFLDWCNPDENYGINKTKEISSDNITDSEAIVPIISSSFDKHENARCAYTNLQRKTNKTNIKVHNVHYNESDMEVTIILEPYEI